MTSHGRIIRILDGRRRFPRARRIFWLFLAFIGCLIFPPVLCSEKTPEGKKTEEDCDNPDVGRGEDIVRMITPEELSPKNGADDSVIWLSIMGEVYDVTEGTDYYGPGNSYSAFSGRDASVPFCTGKFTPEEAEKSPDVLKDSELPGLADWRDFYRKHEKYKFVGKLIDERYYNEIGEPTEAMIKLLERIQVARAEQRVKEKKRKEERAKRKKKGTAKVVRKQESS